MTIFSRIKHIEKKAHIPLRFVVLPSTAFIWNTNTTNINRPESGRVMFRECCWRWISCHSYYPPRTPTYITARMDITAIKKKIDIIINNVQDHKKISLSPTYSSCWNCAHVPFDWPISSLGACYILPTMTSQAMTSQ